MEVAEGAGRCAGRDPSALEQILQIPVVIITQTAPGEALPVAFEFPSHTAILAAVVSFDGERETARKGLFAQPMVMALMHEHHIRTPVAGPNVNIIRLLPPLAIGDAEVKTIAAAFDAVMAATARGGHIGAEGARLARHVLGLQV